MTDRFSESQMLRLVEVYRDYECLWNVTSELYKNREARQIAYKEIYKRLNIPGLELKDIPKKIKNLRSSYCQELKRIENSIRQGNTEDDIYEPKVFWFSLAESYLKPFIKRQEVFTNDSLAMTLGEMPSSRSPPASAQTTNPHLHSKQDLIVERSDQIEVKQEDGSEEDAFEEDSKTNIRKVYFENYGQLKNTEMPLSSSSSRIIKHNYSTLKDEDIPHVISRMETVANNITKCTIALKENKEDEYDMFGCYIAKALRALPKDLSFVAKLAIQKSLSEVQMNAMRKEKNITQSQGCSSTTDANEYN